MEVAQAILARLKKEYDKHLGDCVCFMEAVEIVEEEIEKAEKEIEKLLRRPPIPLTTEQETVMARIPVPPQGATVFPVDNACCCSCKGYGKCLEIIVPSPCSRPGLYDKLYACELCYKILLEEGRLNLKMEKLDLANPGTNTKEKI